MPRQGKPPTVTSAVVPLGEERGGELTSPESDQPYPAKTTPLESPNQSLGEGAGMKNQNSPWSEPLIWALTHLSLTLPRSQQPPTSKRIKRNKYKSPGSRACQPF